MSTNEDDGSILYEVRELSGDPDTQPVQIIIDANNAGLINLDNVLYGHFDDDNDSAIDADETILNEVDVGDNDGDGDDENEDDDDDDGDEGDGDDGECGDDDDVNDDNCDDDDDEEDEDDDGDENEVNNEYDFGNYVYAHGDEENNNADNGIVTNNETVYGDGVEEEEYEDGIDYNISYIDGEDIEDENNVVVGIENDIDDDCDDDDDEDDDHNECDDNGNDSEDVDIRVDKVINPNNYIKIKREVLDETENISIGQFMVPPKPSALPLIPVQMSTIKNGKILLTF